MKSCKRCGNGFAPINNMQLYCKFCTFKHLKEARADRKKRRPRRPEEARFIFVKKEWEASMEKRANYIADYYIRTGVLLNW